MNISDVSYYNKRCDGCGQFIDSHRHLEGITNRCNSCVKLSIGTMPFPIYEGTKYMKLDKTIFEAISKVAKGQNVKDVFTTLVTEDRDVVDNGAEAKNTPYNAGKGSAEQLKNLNPGTKDPHAAGHPGTDQGEATTEPYKKDKDKDPADKEPGGAAKSVGSADMLQKTAFESAAFDDMYKEARELLNKMLSEDEEDEKKFPFKKKDTKGGDDEEDSNSDDDKKEPPMKKKKEESVDADEDDEDGKEKEEKKKPVKEDVEQPPTIINIGEDVHYSGAEVEGLSSGALGRVMQQFPHANGFMYSVDFQGVGNKIVSGSNLKSL